MVLLLVALIGGTSAAFAITQSLKNERSPVGVPRFTPRVIAPTCDCPGAVAELALRMRSADRVTAEIVDADGDTVRILATDEPVRRGPLSFQWDGRADDGAVAQDGRYRLKVDLEREGRTLLLPTTITVDTVAPRVRILEVRQRVDGKIGVVYRADDRAAAVLAVEGEELPETVVNRGRFRPRGRAKINWSGQIDGVPLPPGEYTLVLQVRDTAGNLSKPVRRTIELGE